MPAIARFRSIACAALATLLAPVAASAAQIRGTYEGSSVSQGKILRGGLTTRSQSKLRMSFFESAGAMVVRTRAVDAKTGQLGQEHGSIGRIVADKTVDGLRRVQVRF